MISGEWLISFGKMVLVAAGPAGAAWIIAFKKGKASKTSTKIEDPVPEVPVKRIYTPPTFSQHQDVVRRVAALEAEAKETREHFEGQLRQIRSEQHEQFVKLMEAGEMRKDMIFEKIESMARGFHSRVDQIIQDSKISNPSPRKR